MAYASGRKSQAICDRCGLKYPYPDLKEEWTGLRVCSYCYEPKHPQLNPHSASDPEALRHPRPGSHGREDAQVRIVSGLTIEQT